MNAGPFPHFDGQIDALMYVGNRVLDLVAMRRGERARAAPGDPEWERADAAIRDLSLVADRICLALQHAYRSERGQPMPNPPSTLQQMPLRKLEMLRRD